jgi:hypothetical protein
VTEDLDRGAPAIAVESRMGMALGPDEGDAEEVDIARAARADELTRRLRDDPANEALAEELTSLLEDLSRGHELVALLVGRLEDASPDRRDALARQARDVFERMAVRAEGSGRHADAALYRDALATLPL